MMDEEVAWLKRKAGIVGDPIESEDGGSGSGERTPDPQPISSTEVAHVPPGYGDRAETRVSAGPTSSSSNGGGVGASDVRAQERSVVEFGPRERPPSPSRADLYSPTRAEHYRLSHMANVALNTEAAEQQKRHKQQQQQQHSQNTVLRRASAPKE